MLKKNLGKTSDEISEEIGKLFDKINNQFGVQTFSEQFEAMQQSAEDAASELVQQELNRDAAT